MLRDCHYMKCDVRIVLAVSLCKTVRDYKSKLQVWV